ncbi:hypothetical protein FRC03_002388 [Tulasnella sp. 419]|nr:hypothetical protein FRC02_002843 [Tulasnella sp. 418]KAG8963957.1 hypothetical protein FRC03_002388 [Tulasnella sp. 419]
MSLFVTNQSLTFYSASNSTQQNGIQEDEKYMVFLDIDNTLYPQSMKIHELMGQRIHAYFLSLGMNDDDAHTLHMKYYKGYGLALRGLTRHHQIDPMDFDRKCDGSLPLEDILKPDPSVRKLLQDLDRSKTRVWALTNAYSTHAYRVLKILQLDDLIEGVYFCDYSKPDFSCKPEPEFYLEALQVANVKDPSKCYFVDDNLRNVRQAKVLGWGSSVYYKEPPEHPAVEQINRMAAEAGTESKSRDETEGVDATIESLMELRNVWSHLFVEPQINGTT